MGSVLGPNAPRSFNPKGLTIPPEDARFEKTYTLKFDRTRFSYAYKGGIWSGDTGAWSPQEYFSVFDGNETKTFWPAGSDPIPNSVVRPDKVGRESRNIHARSVMMAYRAVDLPLSLWRAEDLALSPSPGIHKGKACIVVEEKATATGAHRSTLWVDPALDYSVVRCTISQGANVYFKLDIEYEKDQHHGYVPKQWNGVYLKGSGGVKESFRASVADYALNNPEAVGDIVLALPPDTYVIDERTKQRYITRNDGAKRIITAEEDGATYQQLVNSESGQALMTSRSAGWWKWLIAGLLVLCAGFALGILIRRRRRGVWLGQDR
jgi:hypothetical protein